MKSLYKFTEERIEQMDGKQLEAINQSCYTHDAFHQKLADNITGSNAYQEWQDQILPDPKDKELAELSTYMHQRYILQYIKLSFTGIIEDRIFDYHDFQDLREDPCGHFGVSERNIVGGYI